MIKPQKKHFLAGENRRRVKDHSELSLRDCVDLLKIDKHGQAVMSECRLTGRKSLVRLPNEADMIKHVPKDRLRKLVSRNMIVTDCGYRVSITGFVHFWFHVGAWPY